MGISIQVSGLKELRVALKAVSLEAPKELAKANHEVGQIVVDEAKDRAPSGPHQGGGSVVPIAESIHANQAGTNVTVIVGGPRSPHAVPTEFGGTIPRRGFSTSGFRMKRGYRSLGAGHFTHIAKRPYLFPAIEATQGKVKEAYMKMLDALVTRFRA